MKQQTLVILVAAAIANALLSAWVGQQAYGWMPPQASAEALLVDDLFSFLTTIGSFIFFGVSGTLLYALLFQRASKYDVSDGPPIEGNITLEVVWTAIPFVLVIWIGIYSFQIYEQMGILGATTPRPMAAASPASIGAGVPPGDAPIQVRARQWAWEFYYPEARVTSTELHLPVNQRAQLQLTSEDVIHGFYVPAFRVKQDVIPGEAIDFSLTPVREGRYRLRDSLYSGTYFAANQTNVVVESAAAYQQWLQDVATRPLVAAENRAFEEYSRSTNTPISLGWETVPPAPAPFVNFSSSDEDPHE